MVPLLKLLVVLGPKYNMQLLNNVVVTAILRPLMTAKEIVYSKLKKENVTMYLQCLVTVLKLSQIQLNQAELRVGVFNDKNVRFIVAMAIKNGNKEQRVLALDLLKAPEYFPPSIMAEVRPISITWPIWNCANEFIFLHPNSSWAKQYSNRTIRPVARQLFSVPHRC